MTQVKNVSGCSNNPGAISTNPFQILAEAFCYKGGGCNYKVNEVELRKPLPNGMMYAELVCDSASLGGTGRWSSGYGYIDYTRLPQTLKQALIKEGLFLGKMILAHQCEDGSSYISSF